MVCPRNTKPKKKGMTPSKNTNKLLQDLDSVEDIRFKLGLYSRYLRMVIQANITPNPMSSSLWAKIASCSSIPYYNNATKAPKIWKKFPVTMTKNQKSKNLSLSKNPSSSQFFCQLVCPLNLDWLISLASLLFTPAFLLK